MNIKNGIPSILGPLDDLYADPAITEIMVNGLEEVVIERNGKLEATDVMFDSEDQIVEIVTALLAQEGRTLDPVAAKVELGLPDRQGRAVAIFPPTAVNGPYLVIRWFSQTQITWEKILKWGAITPEAKELIQQAILDDVNILVAGGTWSGKTTLMNRIAELVPTDKRIVIVEEMSELQIEHPQAVYLQAGEPPRMAFDEAIYASSLMRPDWQVFSEINGPAGMAALEMFSRGYTGISNIHGNSAEDSLTRLEAICLKNSPGLGPLEIRNMISAAFQLVLYQQRLSDGSRKVTEIMEICGVENGRYVLQRLFRFNPEAWQLEPTGAKPKWNDDFA